MDIYKLINKRYYNIIIFSLLVILDFSIIYSLTQITRYSGFAANVFTIINVVSLIFVLIINGLAIFLIYKKMYKAQFIAGIVFLVLAIAGLYLTYATTSVNDNVSKIVNVEKTIEESKTVDFITYNNALIITESDIANRTFGVVDSEEVQEGNVLAKAELTAKNIDVDFVEFPSYTEAYMALIGGDVDVIAVPSNYAELFSSIDGLEVYLENTTTVYSFDEVVEVDNDLNTDIDVTKEPFTVLVIGMDEGRSDSLMALTINPTKMNITITSIPRDTYVPISCYSNGGKDKITHARMYSRKCTIDTVSDFLDTEINFYIESNFSGVVDIVDALDGLYLTSPVEFVGQLSTQRGLQTVWVGEGPQWMSGEQALAFARERHSMPNGDYDRAVHQQEVVTAMIDRALSTRDVNKLLAVLDAAGKNVTTNMSVDTMTSLASYSINAFSKTFIDSPSLILKQADEIPGVPAYYYNYAASLPLWISVPYPTGISDGIAIMKSNLISPSDEILVVPAPFEYSIAFQYDDRYHIASSYNENVDIPEMPKMVPDFLNGYNEETAKVWATQMGTTLNITYIYPGTDGWNDEYVDGQIISQVEVSGTLLEKVSSVNITVAKTLDEDQMVPNLVGMSYTNFVSWANSKAYTTKVSWIVATDDSLAGTIATQDVEAKTPIVDQSEISVTVYGYPKVATAMPNTAKTTETELTEWANANLTNGSITYVYVYKAGASSTLATTEADYLVYGNPSSATYMTTGSTVTVKIFTADKTKAEIINDTVAPVITLSKTGPVEISVGAAVPSYASWATAKDDIDGTVTVKTSPATIDTSVAKSYTITYTATDKTGNTATKTIVINVKSATAAPTTAPTTAPTAAPTTAPTDTVAPVITLNKTGPVDMNAGDATPNYEEWATATDAVDGTVKVTSSSSPAFDNNVVGSYTITYTATDNAKNTATKTIVINVNKIEVEAPADETAPVIALTGVIDTITKGATVPNYASWAKATYAVDGTVDVKTSPATIDTSVVKAYTITYTASDKAGNIATSKITINVNEAETEAPASDTPSSAALYKTFSLNDSQI